MRYTTLGSTALRVPCLGLGTVFRQQAGEAVCRAVVDAALAAGCNFIDTSNTYQQGESERILGRVMQGRRDRFVVTTKVGAPETDDPEGRGLTRGNVLRGCERSLRRLQTDYVDLFLCHFPDPDTPVEETVAALDVLVQQGKARYVGCSNFERWRLDEALHAGQSHGQARFACNQLGYSLLDRRIEDELIPFCAQQGVGITVYASTAIGLLSGRYRYGSPPPVGSSWHRGPYNYRAAMGPDVGRVIEAVLVVAGRHGRTPTQVAMAWCLARSTIDSVIIGCDTAERVNENLGASDWVLPPEEVHFLDEVSAGQRLVVRKDCREGYETTPAPTRPTL
jgi:aryl-alcohol dehydrogenase-like predicted oxidoreductase